MNHPQVAEILLTAFADEDSLNVQLAARHLGVIGACGAVAALTRVAKGEGQGNRDAGPRIEAVKALARIGSPDALSALSELVGRRGVLGSGKAREVRAAAESALECLRSPGGVT